MHNTPPQFSLAAVMVLCSIPVLSWSLPDDAATQRPAASFLTFLSAADGRCQILSTGGKLRVLINSHTTHAIDYRLVRVFGAGHRQGLVGGIAPAGGERVPLGCTEVDGRPQDWLLERARFFP